MINSHLQKTLLCVIFITSSVFSFSQFTVYNSSNSGLPYNTVRCVSVDQFTNEVWAGTDFGLANFDGTNWTIYNTSNSGLTDNLIRAVETDPSGNIWVGTLIEGLFMFDGISWVNYTMSNSDLPDNQIKDIEFDQDGFMWVATTGGLAMFNGSVWTVWDIFNSSLPTNNISSIKVATDNSKRIGAVNGGLQIISADNLTMTTYWSYNSSLIDNTILMVDFDQNGLLWMATPSGGLIVHTGGDSWIFYNTFTSDIPTNSATYILIHNNLKYVPTIEDGLLIYDGITFEKFNASNSNMPDNYLFCIEKDTNEIFWMGSYNGGLIKYDPATVGINEAQNESFSIKNAFLQNDVFTFELSTEAENYSVYDLQGKLVSASKMRSLNYQIPTQNLSGIYVFLFTNPDGKQISIKAFVP
jgi:ligand-binding sensor domain-containing protein